MKRRFTKLMAALALLALLVPIGAWGQTYRKVTTAPSDWSGTYVIVADASNVIFTGQSGSNDYGGYATVTITSESVTGDYSNYEVLVEKSGDYYTMKHISSEKYLGWTSGNNLYFSTDVPTSNAYKWTLSTSSILNADDNNRKLQYNSGSPRFACYTSSQKVAYLYLKDSGYTLTSAVIPTGTGTVELSETSLEEGETATATATANAHYTFTSWSITGGGATLSSTTTNPTTVTMGTANATITATFTEDPKYNITYNPNYEGSTDEPVAVSNYAGETMTIAPYTTFSRTGYAITSWNTEADGNGTTYHAGDSYTMTSAGLTLYAQWEEKHEQTVTLTQSVLGLTGSYTTNTEKTIEGITYVYSNLMKSNDNIQAKASTGTIKNSTAYSGDIISVVITHSGTARATTINGSANGTDWTQVATGSGSINADFTGKGYKYFQITRGDNAAYWTKVEITWSTAPSTDPSITAEDVNITYNAEEGNIAYQIENSVEGASIQALLADGATITNFVLDEPANGAVHFTCDANATNAIKTATVTLNYVSGEDILATKEVTVTQAAAPQMALYTYSINGVESQSTYAEVGSTITLVAGQDLNEDFTFAGWTTDPNDVSQLLTSFTFDEEDAYVFYAVYEHTTGIATSASMTIDKNTKNFPTSYGTANTFTEYTLNDKKFQIQQVFYNSDNGTDCLQFRASGNNNGTGIIYNAESFGSISSIVLTYNSNDNNKNFTIKAGSTANPTEGTAITPSINENEYTFDLSGGNNSYFVLTNGDYAGYLDNIIINYTAGPTAAYYTRVFWGEQGEQLYDNYTVVGPSIVPSGMILNVGWNVLTNDNPANLIIEDGAQVINAVNAFEGTVFKNIAGTDFGTPEQPTNGGYYLIASPVSQPVQPSASNGFVTENWDLYAYDATQPYEWRNYNLANDQHAFENIEAHHGYLYASQENTTLSFAGTLNAFPSNLSLIDENDAIEIMRLVYDANSHDDLKSLTLVGNSYAETYDFYVWDEDEGDFCEFTAYTLNDEGDGFGTDISDMLQDVAPMDAFFVLATGPNQKVVKYAQTIGRSNPKLNVKISRQNGTLLDNAIVSFAAGSMAKKLYLTDNSTRVYFPISNQDYAVVRAQSEGEQPVNFKAKENGTYTLSVETKNVEMDYLHLIDNMTGADVDLLATPSYTFEAKTSDYASRFRLVFSANSISEDADGDNAFAYFNGSNWTISNPSTGSGSEATLQVVDVMGRVLSSETLSGNAEVNINQPTGVYMLRLVSGDSVKVQKVVVR